MLFSATVLGQATHKPLSCENSVSGGATGRAGSADPFRENLVSSLVFSETSIYILALFSLLCSLESVSADTQDRFFPFVDILYSASS